MENNLSIEETISNLRKMITIYDDIINELISELENSNRRYEELNEKVELLQSEKSNLEDNNSELRQEVAVWKQKVLTWGGIVEKHGNKLDEILCKLSCEVEDESRGEVPTDTFATEGYDLRNLKSHRND